MNMYICISVYYTIIKMATENYFTSGKNFYDYCGGQLPLCSQIISHNSLLCSISQGLYFLVLEHPVVSDSEGYQQNTEVWVANIVSTALRSPGILFLWFLCGPHPTPTNFNVTSFQGSTWRYFLENCFQATGAHFA